MNKSSEAEFQKAVITLAKLHRWKVMHTQPAQVRPGKWITPNTGDQGVVSETQWDWINTLEDAGQEVHVWRPKDLDKISARLSNIPHAHDV